MSTSVDIDDSDIEDELEIAGQQTTSPDRICTFVLDYGPNKGQECGGIIVDLPKDEDYTGRMTAERICQSCGAVYGSTTITEKPFNRKPTGAIMFDQSRYGTDHKQVFDELCGIGFFPSLDGKKDAKTYYRLRHLYTGSREYQERIIDEGLERLAEILKIAGLYKNHRLANLCGNVLRKRVKKRLPKGLALKLQFAQNFINLNRPDTDEIDKIVASSIREVDPSILDRAKVHMIRTNGKHK
jgi:hypothetical protein